MIGTSAPPRAPGKVSAWFNIPVALFGMVLGLGGLANGWRTASRVWGWSIIPGETLAVIAWTVWGVLLALYIAKWIRAPRLALMELRHPVLSSFAALVPISTSVASLAIAPLSSMLAKALLIAGVTGQACFAVNAIAMMWQQGGRDPETTTPALYVPVVGGFLVSAIATGSFGYPQCGVLFFGAGLLSWFTLESIIVQRLLERPALPPALRATMGLHFTPPAVACVAYLSVTSGPPGVIAEALFGYGLLHAATGIRLLPWLWQQPFGTAYWAYTFGLSALPLAAPPPSGARRSRTDRRHGAATTHAFDRANRRNRNRHGAAASRRALDRPAGPGTPSGGGRAGHLSPRRCSGCPFCRAVDAPRSHPERVFTSTAPIGSAIRLR
jgi:tellurite resistance protein